ncbi:MAG: hypothetical protein LUE93_16440, partial [Bacteroides sp.]|nr:hypothetical protein [Bacteroides sp.]
MYQKRKNYVKGIIIAIHFRKMVFSKEFTVFTAFEADVYAGDEFFQGIINFIKLTKENYLKFYCLKPSAESLQIGEEKYG